MNTRLSPLISNEESVIEFLRSDSGKILVKKRYINERPPVKWLNEALSNYYSGRNYMPVVLHEMAAMDYLSSYDIVPKIYEVGYDYLTMSYEGSPILLDWWKIARSTYLKGALYVTDVFSKVGFRHNDMLPSNVLIYEGKLKIIDFTWSEFKNVDITNSMPKINWCHKGEDNNLMLFRDNKYIRRYLLRRYYLIKHKLCEAVCLRAKRS